MPFLPPVIRTMLTVQWETGMRSNEVWQMTTAMLDRVREAWVYHPIERKTKWKNWNPPILLTKVCVEHIRSYLNEADPKAPFFSPSSLKQSAPTSDSSSSRPRSRR